MHINIYYFIFRKKKRLLFTHYCYQLRHTLIFILPPPLEKETLFCHIGQGASCTWIQNL